MREALTIFRRELSAYFNAPMAYVVAIAYMVLNSSLYVLDIWVVNQVSMRSFFDWISWTACFVIPAITMRSWAEDKKGATYELLLTFPMRSLDLVLGKFFAALVFFLFCLSGSLVIPICLATLSTEGLGPEWGVIFAAYLGTVLAAGLLISLGLFISGLCRDQIEAFIVTLVVAVGLKLVGFGPVASQIESVLPVIGNFLRESVSYSVPLGRFARGIIDFGDILFFLTWTAVFLFLNGLGLEGRMKRGARQLHAGAIALAIPVAALLAGLWLDFGLPRFDRTADKVYTVSDAATSVLESIPDEKPVRLKLYVSPRDEMPTSLRDLERDVVEKLEAFQRESDGGLELDVVHLHADDAILRAIEAQAASLGAPDAAEDDDERGKVEQQLGQEGIVPFRVASGGLTGSEVKVIYAALSMTHGASSKEIVPQLTPGSLPGLEQDLVTRVYRLVNDKQPVVGLLAPLQQVDIPPQQMQLFQQLGIDVSQMMNQQKDDYRVIPALLSQNEQYVVRRLNPSDQQPLADDLDALIVVGPEQLSERWCWEISRFLHEGGQVILGASTFQSGLRNTRQGVVVQLQPVETGIEKLLEPFGVSVPTEMVLAETSTPLSYSVGPFSPPVTIDFRWNFEIDTSSFDQSTALTNGIGGNFAMQGVSPVKVDPNRISELGLEVLDVLRTPSSSWTREVPQFSVSPDINDQRAGEGPLALASLVRGQFPAPDATAPGWGDAQAPPVPEPETSFAPEAGSLLVVGTSQVFTDQAIAGRGALNWSGLLLKNAVDAFALDESLLQLTLKMPKARPIKDISRGKRVFYQFLIIGLAPLAYLVIGILRLVRRKKLQERTYEPGAGLTGGVA